MIVVVVVVAVKVEISCRVPYQISIVSIGEVMRGIRLAPNECYMEGRFIS